MPPSPHGECGPALASESGQTSAFGCSVFGTGEMPAVFAGCRPTRTGCAERPSFVANGPTLEIVMDRCVYPKGVEGMLGAFTTWRRLAADMRDRSVGGMAQGVDSSRTPPLWAGRREVIETGAQVKIRGLRLFDGHANTRNPVWRSPAALDSAGGVEGPRRVRPVREAEVQGAGSPRQGPEPAARRAGASSLCCAARSGCAATRRKGPAPAVGRRLPERSVRAGGCGRLPAPARGRQRRQHECGSGTPACAWWGDCRW